MTSFEVTIRCLTCSHRYKRTLRAASAEALDRMPDPPCPKCKTAAKAQRGLDVGAGRAPAVGGSLVVKATDYTAAATMEDYGLTDLRSDVREGEMAVPKLPTAQQHAVDNFFGGPIARSGRRRFGAAPLPTLKAAVSGRYMTPDTANPIAMQNAKRERPPINVVAGDGVKRG